MKLVVVESPAKVKTVGKYLGPEYSVASSVGHIRDLPKSNKNAIDIEAGFVPKYEISKGKEKTVEELKKKAQKADEVLLATDPDREGEAIAWHITQAVGLGSSKKQETNSKQIPNSKFKRVTFNEITEVAVKEALKHPRDIDEDLLHAQEARRVLDRLFGYDLSGLIWKKVRYGLSAGRVQSPALRILMEREREIRAFEPEDYWEIYAHLRLGSGGQADLSKQNTAFTTKCVEEPRDEKEASRIREAGKSGSWVVREVKETEARRSPRAPFTTSTLQQAASSRLGFAPSRTMGVAQKLYEAGHITYMRTDSTTLSSDAQKQLAAHIQKNFGKEYFAPRQYKTKSASAQEAHEAVRPTAIAKESAGFSDDQKKLYRLIWQRTVSSHMADARMKRTKILANINSTNETIPDFSVGGSRILFDGWLKADPGARPRSASAELTPMRIGVGARGEDTEVPKVSKSDALTLKDIYAEDKQTVPPSRYTEAGLVKELEKRGIGRPSTYASTIKTIQDRGYVEKEGKTLIPTDTGDVVSSFLEEHFGKYISDTFTAEMERELDEIAEGKRGYRETLEDFYKPFTKDIESKKDIEKLTNLGDAPDEFACPKCGGKMVYKLGKAGKFMSCAKFPDCDGARTLEGEEMKGPEETGEMCPKCGKPLVERDGRYGRFISCSAYPKCKYVKADPEQEAKAKTGVKCPECKKGSPQRAGGGAHGGELMARRGRYGEFFSCSEYPKCKFAMKARPTGNTCPECGSLMMAGTKTIPDRCSDKNCKMHRPDKISNK